MEKVKAKRFGIGVMALALYLASHALFAQDVDEAAIAREVTALWEDYLAAFSDGNADYIAAEIYAAPMYQLGGPGPQLRGDRDAVAASFADTARMLAQQDYSHSESRRVSVCVLNESAALLSIVFTRVRTDGTEMSTGGATYLAARFPQGWRLLAQIGHRVDKDPRCN